MLDKENIMKTKYYLLGIFAVLLSSGVCAEKAKRVHIKCHVQLEDKSKVVQNFVTTKKNKGQFIANLSNQRVFMEDGKTTLSIISVYECANAKANFKGKDAISLENSTAF